MHDPGAININVPAKFKEDDMEEEDDVDELPGDNTPNTLLKKCTFALEEEEPDPNRYKKPKRKFMPRNLFNPDDDYFYTGNQNPSLFEVKVDREMYKHLQHDDLDEISKHEVAYKIMKD